MKSMPLTTSPPGGKWAKGGNTSMHGWSGTGTQEPGQTAQEGSGPRRGIAPKAGGQVGFYSSGASNTSFAGTQTAGQSSSKPTGGDKDGFAKGGSTHMHGNRGAQPAQPGCTCPQ